jgi:ABC-type multidrug transport system permease subunit
MKVWAVMERDLLRILRNPASLASAVLLPILYLVILGNSLQGPLKRLPLGMVIQDEGPQARQLVGALQAVERGPGTVVLVAIADPVDGFARLRSGELSGLLVVPPGFSRDLARGLSASAGLYVDNVDAIAANAIESTASGALSALRQPLARFERQLGEARILPQEIYPRVDYDTSLVPAVVVMAIFMGTMIAGGFNLVMDRFLGVHESYLSTPLTRIDLALGVLGSGTLVTMATSSVVMWTGLLATGARVHGGVPGYLVLVAVQLLATLGLLAMMMSIMGRAQTPRISGVLGGFLNVILFFPSGALYPIASFPPWLRAVAVVNPETHAIAAIKAILFRSGDLGAAGAHVAFLAAFAAAMTALAVGTLKRRL